MTPSSDNILIAAATAFAFVIIGFAAALPKILSSIKRDSLDGSFAKAQQDLLASMQATYEAQLKPLRDHINALETRMAEMHELIDNQQVSVTRLRSSNISLRSILTDISNDIAVSDAMRARIARVAAEDVQA